MCRNNPFIPYRCKIEMALELTCILERLHGNGVVHGDLKCPNILIADDDSLLLCGLGCSKCLEDPPSGSFIWYVAHVTYGAASSVPSTILSRGAEILPPPLWGWGGLGGDRITYLALESMPSGHIHL